MATSLAKQQLKNEVLVIEDSISVLTYHKRRLVEALSDIQGRIDMYEYQRESVQAMVDSDDIFWIHKNESDLSGKFNEEKFLNDDK